MQRFTIERDHWYGLTMFPGYGDVPYHSPIRVDSITPTGGRCFDLAFLNLGYADGVSNFKKRLRTLRRCNSHIVAEETEVEDRTYVICVLNRGWMQQHYPLPGREIDDLFGPGGELKASAFMRLSH